MKKTTTNTDTPIEQLKKSIQQLVLKSSAQAQRKFEREERTPYTEAEWEADYETETVEVWAYRVINEEEELEEWMPIDIPFDQIANYIGRQATIDSADHTGEHQQDEITVPSDIIVREHLTQQAILGYVNTALDAITNLQTA